MSLKYSIIFPYFYRPSLRQTLSSLAHFYHDRNDYEVIVIEDYKNLKDDFQHNILRKILLDFRSVMPIQYLSYIEKEIYNPTPLFNMGVKASKGQYLVLTNPECLHTTDILRGLDEEFEKDTNEYVVCGCLSVAPKYSFDDGKIMIDLNEDFDHSKDFWYQHSAYLNRLLHFCSAISKDTFLKIGGFDEEYAKGIAYDDDDFRETVLKNGVKIVPRDDLVVYHIQHDVSYQIDHGYLKNHNADYYSNKWKK